MTSVALSVTPYRQPGKRWRSCVCYVHGRRKEVKMHMADRIQESMGPPSWLTL
ncbi:hypothetical protein SCLCIDRAFT_1224211 [Scleroderma citrinum Foug A]|uniref:Uncharacterized protein n=1 Tax=Scleroderma citrinum Foug A TaxID=1036808 RepID=A0A0C3D5P5_9AGAM|nr:hypothetical protein SCLCIDRAFT_1224211 [Scleroderma citrinum Foug A]